MEVKSRKCLEKQDVCASADAAAADGELIPVFKRSDAAAVKLRMSWTCPLTEAPKYRIECAVGTELDIDGVGRHRSEKGPREWHLCG